METFKNCKEVEHIIIMITDHYDLSYVIFDQPQAPLKKSTPPLKIQKVQVSPILLTLKIFQGPPAERGEDTAYIWGGGLYSGEKTLQFAIY